MQLYKITEDYRALQDMDDCEAVTETLELIEGEFKDKAENCLSVIANWSSDVEQIDVEIKRLQAMKKSYVNKQESLKEYLRTNMEATGISKIECSLFKISLGKGNPVAVINNEDEIPDEYVTVKTVIAPDKREILKALKGGAEIPGASLEIGQSKLTIK